MTSTNTDFIPGPLDEAYSRQTEERQLRVERSQGKLSPTTIGYIERVDPTFEWSQEVWDELVSRPIPLPYAAGTVELSPVDVLHLIEPGIAPGGKGWVRALSILPLRVLDARHDPERLRTYVKRVAAETGRPVSQVEAEALDTPPLTALQVRVVEAWLVDVLAADSLEVEVEVEVDDEEPDEDFDDSNPFVVTLMRRDVLSDRALRQAHAARSTSAFLDELERIVGHLVEDEVPVPVHADRPLDRAPELPHIVRWWLDEAAAH